jgi:hypothetical protein
MRVLAAAALLLSLLAVGRAAAQVIEPNGLQVPLAAPEFEPSLQSYFDALQPPEAIDAVSDASATPATFSPLCGFEAELVMSQSSARAGLSWYNVPADPNAPPSAIYPVVEETTMPGATLSSAAIRDDPSYQGGLIGFALTKFGGQAIYYSEDTRNTLCSGCAMPGHWKLMLAYPSSREDATYYLAWEDWEGANETSWPDDGDFNDKVFRLKGVRCAGGGEPCDTGKPGACAPGLTECQARGTPLCQPLQAASAEQCDSVDNDCNGVVDDAARCQPGEVCVRGACVWACGGDEFPCLNDTTCDEGLCVETACVGVRCEVGKTCRTGECVSPCEGVVCPLGQECRGSICVDPCAAVSCKEGSVCERGVCIAACGCSGCPGAERCDEASGRCVEPGCEAVRCAAGSVCRGGECVAACEGARCPLGAACVAGQCEQDSLTEPPADPATTPRATLPPPAAGQGGPLAQPAARRDRSDTEAGCACDAPGNSDDGSAWPLLVVALLGLAARTRCRTRSSLPIVTCHPRPRASHMHRR